MKTVYLSIAMASAALSFASCTKNDNVLSDEPQSGPFEITIIGEMGGFETSTKSSVESVIRMKWNTTKEDDKKDIVWAYGYDGVSFKSLGDLKATSSDENPYTATLSGTITEIPEDGNLYLVHGTYRSKPEVSSDGSVTIDMSTVRQDADVTPFIIYSTVNVSDTALSGQTARFSFATTVVKVNLTGLGAGAGLTTAVVSGINKTCSLSFSNGGVTVSPAAETPAASDLGIFVKKLSGEATVSGTATFFLGVPAVSAVSDRKLTITAGGKTYTDEGVLPGAHPANKYVNTICCLDQEESLLLPGKFTVSSSGKQVQFTKGNLYWDGSDWKLEDSQTAYPTDWHTTHVGHFFWTSEPADSRLASYNSTSTTTDGFFCSIDKQMTVDGQEGLYVLTGGNNGEWEYLINERIVNEDTGYMNCANGVDIGDANYKGLFIFPDGYAGETSDMSRYADFAAIDAAGIVFLPAAGRRPGGRGLSDKDSTGFYWSSTPGEDGDDSAYFLYFNNSGSLYPACETVRRDDGLSIRLVYSVK